MTRINLVQQPIRTPSPQVWVDGQWKDVTQTVVVTTDTNNKIPATVLPREATVANTPEHVSIKSWLNGDIVYKNSKLYRANSDIPVDTVFVIGSLDKQWSEVSASDAVINTQSWTVYNPGLTKPVKVGDMFYYNSDLYRCVQANTGQHIGATDFFERLTGYRSPKEFSKNLSYLKTDVVNWAGTLASPNADIPVNSDFAWGTTGTTWKPLLVGGGTIVYTWKGIAPTTAVSYVIGDVIVLNSVSSDLYCCIASHKYANNANVTMDLSKWVPVVSGVGVTAMRNYMTVSNQIIPKQFTDINAYEVDTVLSNNGKLWLCKTAVSKGSTFNAGGEWVPIGSDAITTYDQTLEYKAMSIVKWTDGDAYMANEDIPANTTFSSGLTGQTWRRMSTNGNGQTENVIVGPYQTTASYVKGQLIMSGTKVYAALVDSAAGAWSESKWQLVSDPRVYGDIKPSFKQSDHDGWFLLNGRSMSTLTTAQQKRCKDLGMSTTIPNTKDRFLMGGTATSPGTVGGASYIPQSALPNTTLSYSGTTGGGGSDITMQNAYDKSGNPNGATDSSGSAWNRQYWRGTNNYNVSTSHGHSFSGNTSSLNGGQAQTVHLPPYTTVNYFMYLGLD